MININNTTEMCVYLINTNKEINPATTEWGHFRPQGYIFVHPELKKNYSKISFRDFVRNFVTLLMLFKFFKSVG